MNEQEYIRACKQGDLQHFDALYSTYVQDIYRFVAYRIKGKEQTEDIVSDIFFKALDRIDSCDENRLFRTWLYTIARNTVIDHYRTHKHHASLDHEDAPDIHDTHQDIERDTINKESLAEVKDALHELTDDQREIVTLRVWDELSYKEIAAITGKTEGNCKMIFSRGVHELRDKVSLSSFALLVILSL